MPDKGIVGVISGDIVKSSRQARGRQAIMDRLDRALGDARRFLKERGCRLFASKIYRGDAFQWALSVPDDSLWAAAFVRTELIKLRSDGIRADVRLGIGLGPVSSWNEGNIASSDGIAFRLSGRALDSLKSGKDKYRRLRILTPSDEENPCLSALAACLDAIMQRWTAEQAEAMSLFLRDVNQADASRLLDVKQPAVHRRLQTAGHFAVKEALESFSRISRALVITSGSNKGRL
jgi:hypothetical protein